MHQKVQLTACRSMRSTVRIRRSPHRIQALKIYAPHQETCTMKFEASGRNASSLSTIRFQPSQLREMASFVIETCVLPNKEGGFVTRQIKNTWRYLIDPKVDADFVHGFRRLTTQGSLTWWNFTEHI